MYFTSFRLPRCWIEETWEGMEGYPSFLAVLPPGFLCDAVVSFLDGDSILDVPGWWYGSRRMYSTCYVIRVSWVLSQIDIVYQSQPIVITCRQTASYPLYTWISHDLHHELDLVAFSIPQLWREEEEAHHFNPL